jgi:Ni/Co efflux regulator RcnB
MNRTTGLEPASVIRKLVLVLLVAPVCFLSTAAFAQRDDHRDRGHEDHDNGRDHRFDRHDDHDRGYHRGRDYSYAQPVYVPRPVYREPRPSPGISIFLPLELRR